MTEVVALVLAIGGGLLMVVAGLGLVRMPDLPTRMHASSKAGTLGAMLLLSAVGVHHADLSVAVRAVLICLFFLFTAPVASHLLARAAYRAGIPLSDETLLDELAEANED